ncbi:DUF2785 domain-containing protein [Rossellomorea sp. AcN35-11]|nr:DUF2785 domain-containing protein [Rossellomorea aquimaris]WJV28740.1 DUF2785 domain-containing protein [Rossellomorea sp. AcN35-11]
MISEAELKRVLRSVDFSHPDSIKELDMENILKEMTLHIGSSDGELRDQLIYTSFYRFIERDYLSNQQLVYLLDTCMNKEHLFFGIGKKGDDSVFTRAFSSLVLAIVLKRDRHRPFLPTEKVQQAFEACFLYLEGEEDTRGYVEGKGWAHSIAHGADFLVEVIHHPAFPDEFHKRALEMIKTSLLKEADYCDDEEGRLLFAIEALIDRGMTDETLLEWTEDLVTAVNRHYLKKGYSLYVYRNVTNVSDFLRSYYFRMKWKGNGSDIMHFIDNVLEKWHNHQFN